MAEKKVTQYEFAVGARQSTLFSFTPEAEQMLAERGLAEAPVTNIPPPPPPTPPPIVLSAGLGEITRTAEGYRMVPADVTDTWHLPNLLRDYQEQGLENLLEKHRGTAYLPPGAGKTLLAIAAIEDLRLPTIVLVPTKVLVSQWTDELAKAGIYAGEYSGEAKEPSWVTVSTYQSLFRYPDIIRKFPFIVFDEADLATAEDFQRLIKEAEVHPYVLAMTGTPPTGEGRVALLEKALPVLVKKTPREIGEAGNIVLPEIHPVPVTLTGQEADDYEKYTKALRAASAQLGGGGPEAASRQTNSPNPEIRAAAFRYLKAYQMRREVVNLAHNKVAAVIETVKQFPNQKILLFSDRIDALDSACLALTEAGLSCRVLSGDTPPAERRRILEGWGRSFNVLASAKVLERGFNVPEVSVAVIMASGQSAQQILQRFGRIGRPAPGKTRADAYVIYARGTYEEEIPGRMKSLIDTGT